MKIDMVNVPELWDVPNAIEAQIVITRVPCGTCYTTAFYDVRNVLLRQDQHVVVDKFQSLNGAASL
jgi:hypothetical protein